VAPADAVALHGAVRGTVDIDLVIRLREADFLRAERALISWGSTAGCRSRRPKSSDTGRSTSGTAA